MDRDFTVIPSNYPHTTNSDIGTISRWEYLFIDVEGFLDKFINNSVKKEKIVQRINSRSLFLNEKENRSMAGKILKILDIMRDGEEFYLEEAKGVLASASCGNRKDKPGFRRRTLQRRQRKSHGYDIQVPGLYF